MSILEAFFNNITTDFKTFIHLKPTNNKAVYRGVTGWMNDEAIGFINCNELKKWKADCFVPANDTFGK